MVFQRRLYYGFTGYHVPVVPRASRSARGRRPITKKCEANQIHAFEILASVAGNLLQDGDRSSPSNAFCEEAQFSNASNMCKWDQENGRKSLKADPSVDSGTSEMNFACMLKLQSCHDSTSSDKIVHTRKDFTFQGSLASECVDHSETGLAPDSLADGNSRNSYRSSSGKVHGHSFFSQKISEDRLGVATERKPGDGLLNIRGTESRNLPLKARLVDAMELEMNQAASICSQSNREASLSKECKAVAPFSMRCTDKKLHRRDDDKISVGCSDDGTAVKTFRSLPRIRDRRIRKPPASRYDRGVPSLKGGGCFSADGKTRQIYYSGRSSLNNQRSQKIFPFKKRKFFDQSPLTTSDIEFHCEDAFSSPDRRTNASRESSSIAGQHASPNSKDCNVKLSIKSFKVPELFVEIPATATVGSLKRTVLEAVTAILGDGLHVDILLQGKKVGDDDKTLLQTGISHNNKRHNLGFMLEPRHAQIKPPHCSEDPPFMSRSAPRELSSKTILQTGISDVDKLHDLSFKLEPRHTQVKPPPCTDDPPFLSRLTVPRELSRHTSLILQPVDDSVSDSKALVAVPAISVEALAVVPFHQKSVHPELVQRRIRRPFSVSEVEALVQAVEKLGTGRWRDVKLRAFDNANHRTYVDLKDKWKTLVHTARIFPHQRRGEPVPQELLDRVLAAHEYWSDQQMKHHVKPTV